MFVFLFELCLLLFVLGAECAAAGSLQEHEATMASALAAAMDEAAPLCIDAMWQLAAAVSVALPKSWTHIDVRKVVLPRLKRAMAQALRGAAPAAYKLVVVVTQALPLDPRVLAPLILPALLSPLLPFPPTSSSARHPQQRQHRRKERRLLVQAVLGAAFCLLVHWKKDV